MPRTPITKKQTETLLEALRKGSTYTLACKAAGISQSTFYKYMREGREQKTKTRIEFFEAVSNAECERADLMLERIEEGSRKDWKAAAWLLERRYNYRRDSTHEIEEAPEKAREVSSPHDLLISQSASLQEAIQKAAAAESWQAYAALQRQLLSVTREIQALQAVESEDGLQAMTDEQIISQIEAAVMSMPPVLRQRLQNRLALDLSNVVSIKRG
jgi:hypothetical protein